MKKFKLVQRSIEECKMMKFHFDFEVVPKQSARFGNGRVFKDKKVLDFERLVTTEAKKQLQGFNSEKGHLDGPIYCEATYVFNLPKNAPKWAVQGLENGKKVYKCTTPDVTDNVNKGIIDALSPLIMDNDSRISLFKARKIYGVKPRIEIAFYELPNPEKDNYE